MTEVKTIDGHKALQRMKQLQHREQCFKMAHLTYNEKTGETKGLRWVECASLRPLMPNETFKKPSELFVPYIDIELDEPRMTYRNLIRKVAFPPDFELMKVNWTL